VPPKVAPAREARAIDAAEVGDKVEIKPVTVVCGDENDAFMVLYAGELAMSESRRLGHGTWASVKAEFAAREEALRSAYSCTMVRRTTEPMLVEQKHLEGQPGDVFQTVTYGIRGRLGSLFFIKVKQDDSSPFEPLPAPTQQTSTPADHAPSVSSSDKPKGNAMICPIVGSCG
jgi:hypothetical protein